MRVNKHEVIIGCDVDGTLIRPATEHEDNTIKIVNPYDKQTHRYTIHSEHVELLRQYKGRGFYVKVWSAGGVLHAESVVKALGLDDGTVDEVETKPMKHMDDKKDIEAVVGSRVFIPKEGWVS